MVKIKAAKQKGGTGEITSLIKGDKKPVGIREKPASIGLSSARLRH